MKIKGVKTKTVLCIFILLSQAANADISISGSAQVNVTSTASVNFDSLINARNIDKNMDRDFVLIPLLLSSLFPGDAYIDITTSKTSSDTEIISIPQCCTTSIQPLYSTLPSATSDKSWGVLFNKSIGNTPYYITGDYQRTISSRPSVLPSYEDLIIGNLGGINTIDRDIIKTKTGNIGVGVTHSVSPTSTVYASTSYSKLHSLYTINHTLPDYVSEYGNTFLWQLPAFKSEGRKDTVGLRLKLANNLTVDISKEIFHLNNINLPAFESIKLIHKIDNRMSIGFSHKSSKYIDRYFQNTYTEKSVFLRIGF